MRILNIKVYPRQFYGVLLALLGAGLLISLAVWQLHRAAFKRELVQSFTKALAQPPLDLADVLTNPKQHIYRPVQFHGKLVNKYSFLLDNQVFEHRLGYKVITPVMISGQTDHWLLLDRGWLARPAANTLPDIPALPQAQNFLGTVWLQKKPRFVLSDTEDNRPAWPRVIQRVDFHTMAADLNHAVLPFLIQTWPDKPYTFQQQRYPVVMSAARHTAYAVQWFGLAIVWLLGCYCFIRSGKKCKK